MPFLGNKESREAAMQRFLDEQLRGLEGLDVRKPVTSGFGFDDRPGGDGLAPESRRSHYRRGKDHQLKRVRYLNGVEIVEPLGALGLRGTMHVNGEKMGSVPREYDPDEAVGTRHFIDPDGAA